MATYASGNEIGHSKHAGVASTVGATANIADVEVIKADSAVESGLHSTVKNLCVL
jgi:hypothetical protein